MSRKRKTKQRTAKVKIDKFFEELRETLNIYAFQNESELKYECLVKAKVPCVVNRFPKRDFFEKDDDNTLMSSGFTIFYNNLSNDTLDELKTKVYAHFKPVFWIKFSSEDIRKNEDKTLCSGTITFKNIIKNKN